MIKQTKLQYSCSLLLIILLLHTSIAQVTITGKIQDGTNQEGLESTIVTYGNKIVLSDKEGEFEISVKSLPANITVNHLGYYSKVVTVSDENQNMIIPLEVAPTHLNEVIVSSSKNNESLKEATSSIGVITKQGLQRDDQTIITPALNRIPGVYMHSGSLNTNRITIRGIGARTPFSTDKIRAYFDHIPLTNGVGETTIEDIDLGLIDRVEVIKGPNSSIFGAGLGGVINLKPTLADYQKTTLSSSLVVGSYGLSRLKNKVSFGGNHSNFSLVHSKMTSDGYRANNDFYRESVGVVGRVAVGESGHLSILGNYIYLKSFIPSSLNQSYYDSIPSAAAPNWQAAQGFEQYDKMLMGMSYSTKFSERIEHTTSVFMNFKDAFEPRPRPLGILKENTIGSGFRSITRYHQDNSSVPWIASLGVEYFRDTYNQKLFENLYQQNTGTILGPSQSDFDEHRSYYNLFGQFDLDLSDKLSFEGGINFNQTAYQLKDFFVEDSVDHSGNYRFDPILSPRLGLVYHANKNRHYYLNISHGFSPPNLEETLNPDGAINNDIRPEKGWNYELGTRGYLVNGNLQYSLSGYFMPISDLLVSGTNLNGFTTSTNAGQTRHLGAELDISYFQTLGPVYNLNYFVTGSIMSYHFQNFIDGEDNFSGNELTGTPAEMFNAGIELTSQNGFYANINSQYTGEIPIDDGNTLYASSYFLLRSKVGYHFKWDWLEIDLFTGINNLTNTKYSSMLQINSAFGRFYYPGTPRNYYGGLSVKVGF